METQPIQLIIIEHKVNGTEDKKTVPLITKIKLPIGDFDKIYIPKVNQLLQK